MVSKYKKNKRDYIETFPFDFFSSVELDNGIIVPQENVLVY